MKKYLKLIAILSLCGFYIIITHQSAGADTPVIIGATVSMEGKYQEPSMMIQEAYKFWIDQVNQGGGLLGRKIKLILYDDKSDKKRASILYKKLIEEDKADLIFSPYSSPLTLSVSEISEQNRKLMLAVAASAEAPWKRGFRYLFQLYAPASRQFIGLMDMMSKKNYRTLSLLYDETSAFNVDTVKGVQEWAKLFNINVIFQKGYQDGKKELPGLLAEVQAKNGKGLLLSAYSPDCYTLLHLLKELSYKPTILAMPIAPVHPDFHKNIGDMANQVFGPSQWEPDERIHFPGTRRFVTGFNTFTGHMPSYHAASAYSACQLFEQAILKTQSLDNEKLRDYIAALDTVTVLGRFKVDQSGKQVGHNSFIIQWQNGKKEIVWPQKMQTSQAIF